MRKLTARQMKLATELRIDCACSRACADTPIDLFNGIPAVYAKAAEIVASGADDARLAADLRAFVESIRVDIPNYPNVAA